MDSLGRIELMVLLLLVSIGVALISRRARLPFTLALVLVGLVIGLTHAVPSLTLDPQVVLFLFLPALLFEGAWNVDIRDLTADWLCVLLFAVPGLSLSILIVAGVLHVAMGLPWLVALLLGAMLSPTDPVAVLALLRQLGFSVRLRTLIEGESLFNDGVGAVAFQLLLGLLVVTLGVGAGHAQIGASSGGWLIAAETMWLVVGGLGLGLVVGFAVGRLVRRVDDFLLETTCTFGVAYGVYLLATLLHASGLLAVVGAGLLLGNYSRQVGMSRRTRMAASDIWEFTGYLANSFLFLLLGVQLGASSLLQALPGIAWAVVGVVAGRALMIALVLPLNERIAAWRRWAGDHGAIAMGKHTVWLPAWTRAWVTQLRARVAALRLPAPQPIPHSWYPLILFAGLRGALSVALVLGLPAQVPQRGLLEAIVYGVVLVTLVGQGTLLRLAVPHWPLERRPAEHPPAAASNPTYDPPYGSEELHHGDETLAMTS